MMCRCWRSGGLGVGRALMRSGSEKIRGSRWCGVCVCAPDLRLGRPDLTHRFSQPANNEWLSGTAALCHHMSWCVPFCPQPLFILSSALFSFFQYILALSLDSSLCCSCLFWCISPRCHSVMPSLCAIFHTSVPILMYFIRLGFTLQPISSFSFLLSFLFFSCLWFEDMVIMFSLYLSVKVDYHPNYRPVICTELTYSRLDQSERQEGDKPD
jgi:hypothetical protein